MKKHVYLDSAANAPICKEAVQAMAPFLRPGFCGNSHSAHEYGAAADKAVWKARFSVAKALKLKPEEVYFTSGATESNNWVIKSLAFHELTKPESERRMKIVCSAIEHASVYNACKELEAFGFEVAFVQPTPAGRITVQAVNGELKKGKTLLVCCMAVNNETGVANPVDEIASLAHKNGALMLADFTQAMLYGGKSIRIGLNFPHVDYLSFSGHKVYGPTGVGCLLARSDAPLYPLLSGGTQENGLRGGTHNTAGIAGLGAAVEVLGKRDYEAHFTNLFALLASNLPEGYQLNAVPDHRNIVSINCSKALGVPSAALALSNAGIACSAGSACSVGDDGETETSHVLLAMGLTPEEANATVRVSFSKNTTPGDVLDLIGTLRRLAALYPPQDGDEDK